MKGLIKCSNFKGTNHEQTEVQQEIAEALYKLIEDHTKMVDVATQSEALCRGSECGWLTYLSEEDYVHIDLSKFYNYYNFVVQLLTSSLQG